jgi:hypothetical protein
MVVGDPSSDSQIIVNFPESSMADTLNNVRNTASVGQILFHFPALSRRLLQHSVKIYKG